MRPIVAVPVLVGMVVTEVLRFRIRDGRDDIPASAPLTDVIERSK